MNDYMNSNIISLIVFGSYARGDTDEFSDLDLLGIVDDKILKSTPVRDINLSIYSIGKLIELMETGDLFALHLKMEGRALFGDAIFHEVIKKFKYKETYASDIAYALLMGSLIIENKSIIKNWFIANKRIAWTVRTIIISLSAENREPVFSKNAISNYIEIPGLSNKDILAIINIKREKEPDLEILEKLSDFYSFFKNDMEIISLETLKFDMEFINQTLNKILNEDIVSYDP